ncbi:hypothetical protein ACS0TY_014174 [Phlomoides rotata]
MESSESNVSSPSCRSPSAARNWFSSIVRSRSSTALLPDNSAPGDGAAFSGPINNKRQFHGVAFKTGDYKEQVVFISGLNEGLLASEYLEPLAIALEKEHWSLVQFLFSSSYGGYGVSTLKQDAAELDQLISYLINKDDSHGVILLGHSTGCQDIVHYLRSNAACSRAVRAAILQAPVSDREYMATFPETASMIELASMMIREGREAELMPRKANSDTPITAYRYHSLFAYNEADDLFSSDFSEEELRQKLGHMSNTPTLVMFSMDDECVPKHIDKKALVSRQERKLLIGLYI